MKPFLKTPVFITLALVAISWMPCGVAAEPFRVNGQPIPNNVAVVNEVLLDSKLLISEIKVYKLMNRQKNKTLTDKELADFSHQALARLVDQELIYQEARKKNIQIDPKLVEQRVQEVRKQFPSEEMLQTALDMQGLTMDLLKIKFEKQMMEEALIRQEVAPNVKVNEAEVEAYYQKNLEKLETPEQYEVYHIFTGALQPDAHGNTIQDPALRKKAERLNALVDQDASDKIWDLYRQLQEGADFAELAKEHSEDKESGAEGGSWGAVELSELPETLANEIKKLDQNEISEPVRSSYGYHILKWTNIIPAGHVPLSEIKTDLMNGLLREKTLSQHQEMVSKLREQADIQLYY